MSLHRSWLPLQTTQSANRAAEASAGEENLGAGPGEGFGLASAKRGVELGKEAGVHGHVVLVEGHAVTEDGVKEISKELD